MTIPSAPKRALPAHPSSENLRKQAKRLARRYALKLADAQFKLAQEYGFTTWAALIGAIEHCASRRSPLAAAASIGDVATVRALLGEGADPDGAPHEYGMPLYLECDSSADAEDRIAVAQALLEAGAFTRQAEPGGATPLHAAARRGPLALVKLLLKHGALFWQGDRKNRRPYEYAQRGNPADRDEILSILADSGPRTSDRGFLEAIHAIQQGDIEALSRLLDGRPSLLHERILEPELGKKGYFSDPKLFWVIANNPTYVERSPDNIVEVTNFLIARGVEQGDLDYALELVMTNSQFVRTQQIDLTRTLVDAGARVTPGAILSALGHRQTDPIRWLVENGLPPTAPLAAGLGLVELLPALVAAAEASAITDALGMAVINEEREAARLCLEAGGDPNRFCACHSHSTPLHQATLHGDIETMRLLIAHGARTDIRDTMWRGRPLGWAMHCAKPEAGAFLRAVMIERGETLE